ASNLSLMGYLLSITDTKLHNKSDQNRFWSLCIIIHEKLCLTFWGQFTAVQADSFQGLQELHFRNGIPICRLTFLIEHFSSI
ncbi:MAG: hypothetical protein J5997_13190, partial [Oscillospiraceae bacterium]|nr:hypothetical protein [Oscillospiraceae bacterium]